MEARLTLGETIRRLRRERGWSLGTLAEQTGLSYSHLSRVENDSASPQADAVARLAEALGGDLRELLELANCLPEVILSRIARRRRGGTSDALNRTAGAGEPPLEGDVGSLASAFGLARGLSTPEARALADAVERLSRLPMEQREPILTLILTLDSNRVDE